MKTRDDFDWRIYTENYSQQINSIEISDNSLLVTDFSVDSEGNYTFVGNTKLPIHPNWTTVYSTAHKLGAKSIFEVGAGCGQHLINLTKVMPEAQINGVELLKTQVNFGRDKFPQHHGILNKIQIRDFSAPDVWKGFDVSPDFVFSQAVVMHVSTERARLIMQNMVNFSSKYVLLMEALKDHPYEEMLETMGVKTTRIPVVEDYYAILGEK